MDSKHTNSHNDVTIELEDRKVNRGSSMISMGSMASTHGSIHDSEEINLMRYKSTIEQEEEVDDINSFYSIILTPFNAIESCCSSNKKLFLILSMTVLVLLYLAYFVAAVSINMGRAKDLIIITVAVSLSSCYWIIKKYYGQSIYENIICPLCAPVKRNRRIFKWLLIGSFILLVILWFAIDTAKHPERFMSLAGLSVCFFLAFALSNNKPKIRWRPVFWGISLQFILGIIVLRTAPGYHTFKWIGDRIAQFLVFADAGSKFLFDEKYYTNHAIVFKILPTIVLFTSAIYLLYYLGIMPMFIRKVGWLMKSLMGTTPAESVCAAGNIFIGMVETPLMIRPFLAQLTMSELFAVMTCGLATIAGSVFGAYIQFGISPSNLISASVMSSPAALAIAKLMYPETEVSATDSIDDITIPKGQESNAMEALVAGASMSIKLLANICVTIIMILAGVEMLNTILIWLGEMVGIQGLSFQFICAYIFMPFAYLMGVEWGDCHTVGDLLATRSIANEFIAYLRLGQYIRNRRQSLGGTVLSLRSEIITTYALCGFSNFQGLGIMIGSMSAMMPSRRGDLSRLGFRSLIGATLACFTTASIAGLLYQEGMDDSIIKSLPKATSIPNVTISNRF